MSARASYQMLIDWLGNDWQDQSADVTGRVLDGRTRITVRYGRDQARQLSPISPGELACEIDNISRDYSPENTSSPLYGHVVPGARVQLQATYAGNITGVYAGYIDDFDIKPGVNDRSVPLTCTDALGRLRGVQVTTPLYQGIRTGDAIGYVLDAVGFPADKRDIDPGVSLLPYWWLDNVDAYDAVMQLVDTDGPSALVTFDTQRNFVFRDRHHRLTRAASLTAQATWRSSAIEPVLSDPITYDHGWKEIVNSVSTDVPLRQIANDLSQVWTSQGQIVIAAGDSITITARAGDPFINAVVPEQDTDYTLVSGDAAFSLSQTSGQSTIITISSAFGGIVQDLALRANTITSTSVLVSVADPVSIGKYGPKSMQDGRLPVWANPYDAAAVLTLIVAKRGERLPTLQVTMRGAANSVRLTECLTRDISDRVHITESLTGIDADCYVEQIAHEISGGGTEHVTTFGVEKVPDVATNPFTFDTSGQGFDQGTFTGAGIDNPSTMFRFDTSGQGFDQGVFSN
jgi:hypothetical protein